MRLPEIVLTTVIKMSFSTVSYYTSSMIAGKTEIRYEVLYEFNLLPPLFHRLLVLGVDGLDVLPDEALGVLEVLAALTEDVGRMEGRHRLHPAFEVIPLTTILGDPEVLVYDGLGGGAAEAEDDLRLYRLYLALQVGVAGLDLTRPRLAVLEPSPSSTAARHLTMLVR